MTVKLLDKETKSLVDFEPNAVNAAVDSGKFLFPKNRGVPVRADGQLKYISAADAAKYRDRLLFVNDEDVERGQAEERFGGLGGAAQALAYGGVKGLTLGTVPALASALSPEFAEYSKQIELGRPGVTAAGEIASLAVDPFALAGKALRLGSKGARVAQEAGTAARAAESAAQRAAVSPGVEGLELATARAPVQTPPGVAAQVAGEAAQTGREAMAAEVSPLVLGRQAISTPEEAARLSFRDRSRQSILLREPSAVEFPVAEGAVSTAEPGLRLGVDIYQTPELAMRARQAEELASSAQGARAAEARAAQEAAGMERGLAPGQVGPVEDFTRPPSEFLQAGDARSQMANIEESLQANAAASRRARSEASRERLAAERDRLLAQRDELEYTLFGAETRAEEAMATQAERALDAAEAQAGAPGRQLVSQQMGRIAGEIEAANTLPATLRTAETRVVSENVSPRLGVPAMEAAPPNVSPLGLGMTEAGVVAPSGRLALGGTIPAREAVAATEMARVGASAIPPGLASMSAQGGLYGASEEARRQATGESQGGMGAILGAGALGAAIPAGLMLGGKVAAKGAQALATGAREAGLIERIAAGASTIEKQHIARSFDLSRDQVTRLNNKFAIPEIEQQGTDAFVKFIKGELDDVSKLKAAFPDDAFLQSIPENTSLKFGQLTPDRKKAFADAVERFYGKEYDTIFTDAVRAAPVDRSIIDRIIADTEARAVAGAPQRGLESVAPEIAAMRDYQGQHSVGTLRELQSRIGEIFRGRQGEGGKFTEAQAAMYGGLKRALADAVEAAEPGAAARLAENDVRYEMSKIMAEGANKVLSKATTTSPIGRDLLSQFALGFAAVGHPLAATKFFVTTVGLRHLYNTRGEGIIADMAGKLSTSLRKNPTAAATEAADIIVNARRPMLLGMSATKLTDAKPEDYTSMSRAVRELEATRDKAKRQIADATSGLTPEEQQKSVEFFDNQLNALASALPKGIPTGKALNEQEKNYTIFARAILDPQVYGVQAILNGGLGASVAADAINSLGPQGQEFLQKLGDNLQARISESEQLRGREDMLQTLRNVKTATRKSVGGGGGARLRALHPSSDVKNIAKGAPSAFQNAAKAFSGSAKGIQ